jgi:opacity protein-like surface antigen
MKKATTLLASLALASFASAGTTAPSGKGKVVVTPEAPCPSVLNYSYIEAGYIHLDQDLGQELNGGYLDASYEVAPKILLDGSATLFDENIEQYTVGIGTYFAVCQNFHLTGRTGYSRQNSDGGNLDEWYIAPGFRAQFGCNLELWGKVYLNIGEDEEKLSYGIGTTYHFTPHVGLTAGYAWSEDGWQVQTGLRYSF